MEAKDGTQGLADPRIDIDINKSKKKNHQGGAAKTAAKAGNLDREASNFDILDVVRDRAKEERNGGDEKESIKTILDDPETEDWISKAKHKAGKPNILPYLEETGEEVQRILDDPETEEWLAKRDNYTKMELKRILDDPETQQWLAKKGSYAKDAPANPALVLGILDDPETEEWLAKKSKATMATGNEQELVHDILEDPETAEWLGEKDNRTSTVPSTQIARQQPIPLVERQPGAYSGTPGEGLQRRDNLRFSHVGIHPDEEADLEESEGQLPPRDATGLAEAMPVDDDPLPDMEAQPVDVAAAERRLAQAKKTRRRQLLGMTLFLSVLLVAIVVVVVTQKQKEGASLVLFPTPAPSVVLSSYPSLAPSGALDGLVEGLPYDTLASLETISTPQWKAMNWLENHPGISHLEEWRKTQLFALATFFYAMGGEAWQEEYAKTWLQYDREECFWFAGDLYYDDDAITLLGYTKDPCNQQKEFQVLHVGWLNLSEHRVLVPPEITLLTSLTRLTLTSSTIDSSFTDILPSNLHHLTNFRSLELFGNGLYGTVSSELSLMRSLTKLDLTGNALTGQIPSELGLLTSLTSLDINENPLTGSIPREVFRFTSMAWLALSGNTLSGPLPSDLKLMTKLELLALGSNTLSGPVPSYLGLMTKLHTLLLDNNVFTGPIPCQLGLMTSMTNLFLHSNAFTGTIPTELSLMSINEAFLLNDNSFTGSIPGQLGHVTSTIWLDLSGNSLTGSLPSQLGLLPLLEGLYLHNNTLSGTIPTELGELVVNGSLSELQLENNLLSGTIPEHLCSLGLHDEFLYLGLSFDCNDQLCGCCWCPCPGNNYSGECQSSPVNPSRDDKDWPGEFPSAANAITINIRTDDYPKISFEWSVQEDESGEWQTLDVQDTFNASSLHSYTKLVDTDSLYRLRLFDEWEYGTCCGFGIGWFAITSSAPSSDHTEGSVIWEAIGYAFGSSMDVFIWIDSSGQAEQVTEISIKGAGSIQNTSLGDNITVALVPPNTNRNSTN